MRQIEHVLNNHIEELLSTMYLVIQYENTITWNIKCCISCRDRSLLLRSFIYFFGLQRKICSMVLCYTGLHALTFAFI